MELALKLARSALEDASETLEKAQKEGRNLKDKRDTAPEKERTSRLVWDLQPLVFQIAFHCQCYPAYRHKH